MIRAVVRTGGYSRSRRGGAARRRADQAAPEDRRRLSAGDQPARRLRALRGRPSELQQCRGRRRRRRARRPAAIGASGRRSTTRPARRDRLAPVSTSPQTELARAGTAAAGAGRVRADSRVGGRAGTRRVDAPGRRVFPAHRHGLDACRPRETSVTIERESLMRSRIDHSRSSLPSLALTVQAALGARRREGRLRQDLQLQAVKTWGWNPAGAGDVKMARTQSRRSRGDEEAAPNRPSSSGDGRDDAPRAAAGAVRPGCDRQLLPAADDQPCPRRRWGSSCRRRWRGACRRSRRRRSR